MDEGTFDMIMTSLVVGSKINDLLGEFDNEEQVKCSLCAAIDTWCLNHEGYEISDAIGIVEDMLEMMKDVHEKREGED